MEYRSLGRSGLKVSALTLGTATFCGRNSGSAWGQVDVDDARRMIDMAMDHGVCMFDSADIYGGGVSETILGAALKGKRDKALISTKLAFRHGPGPNDVGTSRYHITRGVETALKKLQTDYIDLLELHGFDAATPVEEVLYTLDTLIKAGKIGYIGVSNFSGWHLMKSLAVSDKYGYARYVAHQAYYSLIGRDYEWELMPLALDQGVGTVVWSPLGWGQLTGKIRRGQPLPEVSRRRSKADNDIGPRVSDEHLFKVVDALDEVSKETGHSIPQVALNWVLSRPSVSSVIIGARNETQLADNLGTIAWKLTAEQIAKLDLASKVQRPYPYWHQLQFKERNPRAV